MSGDFTTENLAFNLAKEFRKHYTKYSFRIYKMTTVKKSKWWVHFMNTAEKYINEKDFDYQFFIAIQFEKLGRVLPHQLPGKNAEALYRQNFYKEDSEESKIISQVKGSKEAVVLWANKNKKDFKEYFREGNPFALQRKMQYVSPFYLAFSKSFLEAYAKLSDEQREQVVSKKDLSLKRALVNQTPGAKQEIRNILQEDFR